MTTKRRVRPKPAFATEQRVDDLLRRFVYPDTAPLPKASQPVGGGGAPTITIAAADSSDASKLKADIVCTGVQDNKFFEQAIQIIAAAGGGRLLVCEGTYHFAATVFIDNTPIFIQGLGIDATIIVPSTNGLSSLIHFGPTSFQQHEVTITDLTFDGNPSIAIQGIDAITTTQSITVQARIHRVRFHRFSNGLNLLARPAGRWKITDSVFTNCSTAGINTREAGLSVFQSNFEDCGYGILIRQEFARRIVGNSFLNNDTAIGGGGSLTGGQNDMIVANNNFSGNAVSIQNQSGEDWLIIGNIFSGDTLVFWVGAGAFGASINNYVIGNIIQGFTTLDTIEAGSNIDYCTNAIAGTFTCGSSTCNCAMADLTDVDLTGLADGDFLTWDDGGGVWVPSSLPTTSFSDEIGDGSNTTLTVVHGLNTEAIIVQLWDLTGANPVEATGAASSIEVVDADTVDVTFAVAPGTDDYRIVILS